ncbi:hypothetical protein DENSPDRAFT_836479, partial [Dentipellis sp. KUC8613]
MAPLRDRHLSNSPDSEWPPQPTTPLRIAKRDTPQRQHASQVSRRSSSTYSKLKNSNLVSQSPFRAQGDPPPRSAPSRPSSLAPSPRRASGEKRPRPISMQAENERPPGTKRRQSKGFQGLIEREPVSKSPFLHSSGDDDVPPPVPPKPTPISPRARLPTPTSSGSPARSSLVSKRFHGPRTLGTEKPKRQRRKTVTFEDRCEVVEYEVERSLEAEDVFMSTDEEDAADPYQQPSHDRSSDDYYGSAGEGHDSITGLVDSMLQETQDDSGAHTPPQDHVALPPDLDAEDGVPYGRSHHAERGAMVHAQQHPTPPYDDDQIQPGNSSLDFHESTPPRRGDSLSAVATLEPGSHMPLGRSTHSERKRRDHGETDIEEDVKMLPPSPSPAKTRPRADVHANTDSLIPKFDIGVHRDRNEEDDNAPDPFANDIEVVELSFMSNSDEMDPANLSVGHS